MTLGFNYDVRQNFESTLDTRYYGRKLNFISQKIPHVTFPCSGAQNRIYISEEVARGKLNFAYKSL